jgi:fumarate reductase subunit D
MRGLITFDLGNLVPLSCIYSGQSAGREVAFTQIYVVAFLIVGLVVFQLWNHYRWRTKNDSRAGERAVHVTHSGWALYTLFAANLVNTTMKGSFYDGDGVPLLVGALFLLTGVIPAYAVYTMWRARRDSRLRSSAFEARMGWLCAR